MFPHCCIHVVYRTNIGLLCNQSILEFKHRILFENWAWNRLSFTSMHHFLAYFSFFCNLTTYPQILDATCLLLFFYSFIKLWANIGLLCSQSILEFKHCILFDNWAWNRLSFTSMHYFQAYFPSFFNLTSYPQILDAKCFLLYFYSFIKSWISICFPVDTWIQSLYSFWQVSVK